MPSSALAVFPSSPRARERCRFALREVWGSVSDLASGWLVSRKSIPGASDNPPEGSEITWEGDERILQSRVFSEQLSETAGRLSDFEEDIGFAQLRPNGSFLAVRSCSGLVAVYFCQDAEGTWISTSFQNLVRCRVAEPRCDALVQALWAEGWSVFPEGRTFFQGIRIVPRGSYLLADGGPVRTGQYWDPRKSTLERPSETLAQAHAEELRDALLQAVGTLDREGLNLLTLSGGVDSSALAYLARSLGFPLATLTFVAPRNSTARAPQLSQVDRLLQELGIEQARRVDADDVFLDDLFRRPLPALYYCPHPALRLLPELARDLQPTVLFNGHFADEVCGHSQRLQDWIRHTSFRNLLDPRYRLPTGLRDLGRWTKRRILEGVGRPLLPLPLGVGPLFTRAIQEEAAEWCAKERTRVLSDPRPLRELAVWCSLDGWVAMHWECCTILGIRPLQPFFTRRILNLAFRCHPSELFGPGSKKILRRALAEHVPAEHLSRTEKVPWNVPRSRGTFGPTVGLCGSELPEGLLAREYQRPGALLTGEQDRQLSQTVLFARKLRELRHAGTGKV